jgi:hypothetical protein
MSDCRTRASRVDRPLGAGAGAIHEADERGSRAPVSGQRALLALALTIMKMAYVSLFRGPRRFPRGRLPARDPEATRRIPPSSIPPSPRTGPLKSKMTEQYARSAPQGQAPVAPHHPRAGRIAPFRVRRDEGDARTSEGRSRWSSRRLPRARSNGSSLEAATRTKKRWRLGSDNLEALMVLSANQGLLSEVLGVDTEPDLALLGAQLGPIIQDAHRRARDRDGPSPLGSGSLPGGR